MPSTISIYISDGSFVCDIPQRCDSGLFSAQIDIKLPSRDKVPTVRAFLAHIHGKEWGRCLPTDLVCFRGQAQLDLTDPATVLVGGKVDILSVQEARESALSSWLGGPCSSNTCGASRTSGTSAAERAASGCKAAAWAATSATSATPGRSAGAGRSAGTGRSTGAGRSAGAGGRSAGPGRSSGAGRSGWTPKLKP